MNGGYRFIIPLILACLATGTFAANFAPQAGQRSNAQNYRDRALAICIANAYAKDAGAARDAENSASALLEWLDYDAEQGPHELNGLIKNYLARDYHYPVPDLYQGEQFRLLKCLDLYHSAELSRLVRRHVKKSGGKRVAR